MPEGCFQLMDLREPIEFWSTATCGIHGFVCVIIEPCLILTFFNMLINLAFILLVGLAG